MTAEVADPPVEPVDTTIHRVRTAVDDLLGEFIDAHPAPVADPELAEGHRLLREFVVKGGKRVRPLLCYWGARGAGGTDEAAPVAAGAALELYHAGLLIHDDIMDGSALRRGRPTLHRSLTRPLRHPAAEPFGNSAAVLLGVLAQAWADELFGEAGGAPRRLFNRMREEVIAGQYLDIQAHLDPTAERALTVIRYKTAKYTVERPLQIGGALAGADRSLLEAYSRFGLPLGEAFQLRDDVLGVFGDPGVTGKPVLDDLREGKATVLMAHAFAEADGPALRLLRDWHGNPDLDEKRAADLRQIIVDTRALARVETMIDGRVRTGLEELRTCAIDQHARQGLALMADRLTHRSA
ncbi:polyprenyl synthetase family protein [Nonomuraea sp. NPDC050790]|uniref:polyprenyl synthetase family protein n=1 Tax=Nonomuraea sp. NPDC050790 TaxID=3364371 RepID=UPI0037B83B42